MNVSDPGRRPGYGFGAWLGEFLRFAAALPSIPLAAPASGSYAWLTHLPRLLSAAPTLALVTAHIYPLSQCVKNPRSPHYPSVTHLLSPSASRGAIAPLAADVNLAHHQHRSFRIDELNSVTCQGRLGVSNTFASSLWMLDILFEAATIGVDGVNVHMWSPAAPNEPFEFDRTASGDWRARVRPEYYGLLMFTRAAPSGSQLLRTRTTGSTDVRSWATLTPDRTLRIILINAGQTRARYALVHVPPVSGQPAILETLQAASAAATAGVTIAGQSFATESTTADLQGARQSTRLPPHREYQIKLPPATAAMLTLSIRR